MVRIQNKARRTNCPSNVPLVPSLSRPQTRTKGRQKKKDTQDKLSLKRATVTIRLTPNPRWSISKWLINKKKGHARQTVPQTCHLNHHCLDHNPLLVFFQIGNTRDNLSSNVPTKNIHLFPRRPPTPGPSISKRRWTPNPR